MHLAEKLLWLGICEMRVVQDASCKIAVVAGQMRVCIGLKPSLYRHGCSDRSGPGVKHRAVLI